MEKNLVFKNESGVAVTTSYLVAEIFGKNHAHVLRDIDNLGCSEEFHKSNFGFMFSIRELPNGGNREERHCLMTKDGFTILAMGYTGKKAMEFKEKYIYAFNKMEMELKQMYQQSIQDSHRAISLCNELSKDMKEMSNRLENVDNRVIFMEKRAKYLDKHYSRFRKPAKPVYLTVSEAITELSFAIHNFSVENFYHCLRELEHIGKTGKDYNRPRGQFATAEMIIAVNIKPDPEEADTEDQDFTLLFTVDFVKIVIESLQWHNAYDLNYYAGLIQKDYPYRTR